MTSLLETRRLWLRPLELADAEQAQVLFPHWDVVRYLAHSVPWPYPVDGALSFYRDVALPAMARGEAWHWTLRHKASPEQLVGSIALMKNEDENRGFWLSTRWRGQGFMTEACDAVTSYWFDVLGFPILRVWKAAANIASRRISQKQGMRIVGMQEREYVCGRLAAELWEITAEERRALRRRNNS